MILNRTLLLFTFLIASISIGLIIGCKKDAESVAAVETCCGTFPFNRSVDNVGDVFIPNLFTPNGDGINDFLPLYMDHSKNQVIKIVVSTFEDEIIHQWNGTLVWSSSTPVSTNLWTGTNDDGEQVFGMYKYDVSILTEDAQTIVLEGSVCVRDCINKLPEIVDFSRCGHTSQHNGAGKWDTFMSSLEGEACF